MPTRILTPVAIITSPLPWKLLYNDIFLILAHGLAASKRLLMITDEPVEVARLWINLPIILEELKECTPI
jgi:hypothetical protein